MEIKYYDTYYYANIVQNVCENSFDYLTNLDGLFGNNSILWYVKPFNKRSILHEFIEFIIRSIFSEETERLNENSCRDKSLKNLSKPVYITPLERALVIHGIEHESFMQRYESGEYDLSEETFISYYESIFAEDFFEDLLFKLTEEVFYILFLNRAFLQQFNELLSSYLEGLNGEEEAEKIIIENDLIHIIRPNFKLFRKNIPTWVQRAVFYRDRGRCTNCNKDLSGILAINNLENYDHIVPLNLYGFNDITNIQLLCKECNAEKSGDYWKVSTTYESWY